MPAMLNLITLYRESLHEPDVTLNNPESSPELAMDYFDTLIARKFDDLSKSSIKEFLGLNVDEEFNQNRVAIQSIPLYCPEAVYEEYHKSHKENYRDPFLTKDYSEEDTEKGLELPLPYLSVIEVFITPEVMARLDRDRIIKKCNVEEENVDACAKTESSFESDEGEALKIYNAFYKDLHMLMEGFLSDAEEDEKFVYCIYKSLSVGDFAVVIRSSRPDTGFKATTLLRKRSCELKYLDRGKKKDSDPDRLVLYKTFTIFSLHETGLPGKDFKSNNALAQNGTDNHGLSKERMKEATRTEIIFADEEETFQNMPNEENPRRYVLRGILSNLYWSNQDNICKTGIFLDILNDKKLRPYFRRLHGRYDFTVTISECAFRAIHQVLVRYKLDRNIVLEMKNGVPDTEKILSGFDLTKKEKLICKTLILYIWKGYVSYINERYLFSLDTKGIDVKKSNEDICLKPVKGILKFTDEYIEEEIQKLRKRILKTAGRIRPLNTPRSSIAYSMKLLEKLASVCSAVNGISDARIYSLVICRQIDAALNGVDEYIEHIRQKDDLKVVEHFDIDLKTAVENINAFAQFILESTLQSFQTPIYNLESHVSVEKMLTSYSWLLHKILEWFERSDYFRRIKGIPQKYLTIMVPDGFDSTLSTRSIYFKLNDKSNAFREKLLTVYCPSFTDLTDFTGAFGILFHEIAHYMRYESRYSRNKMVLDYSSLLLLNKTAEEIARDFCHNIAELMDVDEIWTVISRCLAESYRETVYPFFSGSYETSNMNMMLLIQEIKNTFKKFCEKVSVLSSLEMALNAFLRNPSYITDPESDEIMRCMGKMYGRFFEGDEIFHDSGELKELLSEGIRLADQFYRHRENENEQRKAEPGSEESSYLARLLFKIVDQIETDEEDGRRFAEECSSVRRFYRFFYEKMQKQLDEHRHEDRIRRFFMYFFPEDNRVRSNKEDGIARLRRYISAFIVNGLTDNLEVMEQSLAIYREVSSDLYMVKALGLSPFGYLNFFIRKVPMEDIMTDTYMERFCRVLYSMKGEDAEKREKSEEQDGVAFWRDVFENIFSGIRGFMLQTLEKDISVITRMHEQGYLSEKAVLEFEKLQDSHTRLKEEIELRQSEWVKENNVPDLNEIVDHCYELEQNYLVPMQTNVIYIIHFLYDEKILRTAGVRIRELEVILGDVKHLVFLSRAFIRIVEGFDEVKGKVEKFPILKEDLFIGNRNLEDMKLEFKTSYLMKNYYSKVALEFNEPRTGRPSNCSVSQNLDHLWEVDFIMDMHYGMIWDVASNLIPESGMTS